MWAIGRRTEPIASKPPDRLTPTHNPRRHITDQPGIFHTVVKQYRHYGNVRSMPSPWPPSQPSPGPAGHATHQQPSSSASSSSATAATGPPRFPAVAALPIFGPAAHQVDQLCCDPQRLAAVFCLPSRALLAASRPPRPLIAEPAPPLSRAMGSQQSDFALSPAGFRITPPPPGAAGAGAGAGVGAARQGGEDDVPLLDDDMLGELLLLFRGDDE